jgi:hypothetical protein
MEMVENKNFTTICRPILPDFETNCGTMWQVIVSIGFSNAVPHGSRGTARPAACFAYKFQRPTPNSDNAGAKIT